MNFMTDHKAGNVSTNRKMDTVVFVACAVIMLAIVTTAVVRNVSVWNVF
jgi:hypothetical protein